jgi:hypothetical protein
VNQIFQQAGSLTLGSLELESSFSRFNFTLKFNNPSSLQNSTSSTESLPSLKPILNNNTPSFDSIQMTWIQSLFLKYKMEWPTNLVLTGSVLDRLNGIFRFLLSMKLTQISLERLWGEVSERGVTSKISAKNFPSFFEHRISFWVLRKNMQGLLTRFQFYFQVCVVDFLFGKLCEDLNTTTNYEKFTQVFLGFLSEVEECCFLSNKPHFSTLNQSIEKILRTCLNYAAVSAHIFQKGAGVSSPISPEAQKRVDELATDFEKQCSILYNLLFAMHNPKAESMGLSVLLQQLEQNKNLQTKQNKTKKSALIIS